MIDDRDRCEWVNVSSGTGNPGCPGQNPESCKMVVVVVVVVSVLNLHTGKTFLVCNYLWTVFI